MTIKDFGTGTVDSILISALLVAWAVKLILDCYTAIQNHKQSGTANTAVLQTRINAMENEMKEMKRTIEAHDDHIADLHTGQAAICRGVQALLEHTLHNGNTDEMQSASDGIGKWLRTR